MKSALIRDASGGEITPARQGNAVQPPLRPAYRLRQFAATQPTGVVPIPTNEQPNRPRKSLSKPKAAGFDR